MKELFEKQLDQIDVDIMEWIYNIIDIHFNETGLIVNSSELRDMLESYREETLQAVRKQWYYAKGKRDGTAQGHINCVDTFDDLLKQLDI